MMGVATFMATGLELEPEPDMTPLIEKILFLSDISPPYTNLTSDVQLLSSIYEISSERMAKVLENIVQEGLSEIKQVEHRIPWAILRVNVYKPIEMLQTFHGTNTVALLKE